MRIIFVRHGHPNYRKDCLTELGHLQAKAAEVKAGKVQTSSSQSARTQSSQKGKGEGNK